MLINDQTLTQLNKHISSTLHSHFDLKQNHCVSPKPTKKKSKNPSGFHVLKYPSVPMKHKHSSDQTCPGVGRVTSDTNTTPTHNFTELCDFLKLFAVSASCPMSVSVSVFHRSVQISKHIFHSKRSYVHKLYNEVPCRCVIEVKFPTLYTISSAALALS